MKDNNEIILLKLGGSLLTDKDKPSSIREDVVESAIQQIVSAEEAQQKALDLEPDDFDNFHRFYDFVGDEYRKLKRKNMEVRQW